MAPRVDTSKSGIFSKSMLQRGGRKLMSHNNIDKPDQANGVDPIESANESRPKDENTKVIIANMDEIDFQTLLAEQMNR